MHGIDSSRKCKAKEMVREKKKGKQVVKKKNIGVVMGGRAFRSEEIPPLLLFLLRLVLIRLIRFTLDTGGRRLRNHRGTCVVVR